MTGIWQIIAAEAVGSMILITFGFASIAATTLMQSYGKSSVWVVQGLCWGVGLAIGLMAAIGLGSGGHINPAVTVAFVAAGFLPVAEAPVYFAGQLIGGFLSGVMIWSLYLPHWSKTEDPTVKLACFATVPAIRSMVANLVSEIVSFAFFVFGIFVIVAMVPMENVVGMAFATGALLTVAYCATGGQTTCGYSIDLGTRIAHQVLPIAGKGSSDWAYAWVPILGPVLGGLIATFLAGFLGLV